MESGKLLLESHSLGLNKISQISSYMVWAGYLILVTVTFLFCLTLSEKLVNWYNCTFKVLGWGIVEVIAVLS